jgi:flagellar biosynthesis/type III secretory pathway ATPase
VVSHEHADAARKLREAQAIYEEKRDLVALGGYAKGSDPRVDHALRVQPQIERFLRQAAGETCGFDDTLAALRKITGA